MSISEICIRRPVFTWVLVAIPVVMGLVSYFDLGVDLFPKVDFPVVSVTANLRDVKTIITQPASTSHGRLTEEQRLAAGIQQHLIRVAVGLEHLDDLKADLSRGLDTL